jgi:hypothetical protein
MLDGVDAYNRHVMVLRDGTIRGGGPFFYTVGSFTCSDGQLTKTDGKPLADILNLPEVWPPAE